MENGNTLRQHLEAAEQKNYENYERDVSRRVGEIAFRAEQRREEEGKRRRQEELKGLSRQEYEAKLRAMPLEERRKAFPSEDRVETPEPRQYKHYDSTESIEQISTHEQKAVDAIRKLIADNFIDAARKNKDLSDQISDFSLELEDYIESHQDRVTSRTPTSDYIRNKIQEFEDARSELAEQTPESYTLVHGLEFRECVKKTMDSKMVVTPYVSENLNIVERHMASGIPTFIHGHLGSGKTELAINAAINTSIHRAASEESEIDMIMHYYPVDAYESATKEERRKVRGRAYRRRRAEFEKALQDGDSAAHEKFTPLVVSGSKDLTSQDLFADKTLKLTKFNSKPLLEHKKDLDAEIAKWEKDNPEEAKDPEKCKAAANVILELFKREDQAFGTEVKTIKQAIYRGVEEGRPVIIDEINAIPAAVLISLNDVLQRRPGDNCYIPEVGAVKIQPGFSITMTGNLSSSRVNYEGTGDLNPAFLSRLGVIEHDYLPMSEYGNYANRDNPRGDELFYTIIAYLADRQGNLSLPEMDESLEKLFSLCQLAHETQNIFGGKVESSITMDSGEEIEADLEKSVLSIRNILDVLKEWNKGSEKDLDKALWDGFIAKTTNADDRNLILALAKSYGFFSESNGYNIKVKERGAGFTTRDEIHPGEFYYKCPPLETYSVRRVVELLYGPGPEREVYPEDIDLGELAREGDDEISIDDLEDFETHREEYSQIIAALKTLGEKCGCAV